MRTLITAATALCLTSCSKCYVEEIKQHAEVTLNQAGYDVIGYEGYEYGSMSTFGGKVWYTLKRRPDNGITYEACVTKWGDEYHIYNLTAIDAIKPK